MQSLRRASKGKLTRPRHHPNGNVKEIKTSVGNSPLDGFVRLEEGGLKCVDEEANEKQKGVLVDLLKSAKKSLLEGDGIVSISLPVRIFQPSSVLQSLARTWKWVPRLLSRSVFSYDAAIRTAFSLLNETSPPTSDHPNKIVDSTDLHPNSCHTTDSSRDAHQNMMMLTSLLPAESSRRPLLSAGLCVLGAVERLKYCIAFTVASLHLGCYKLKPFNPILGETYSASYLEESCTIFLEHINHNPPITLFSLLEQDAKFEFAGCLEFKGRVSGNTGHLSQGGTQEIRFHDHTSILVSLPSAQLSGLLWGSPTVEWLHTATFIDKTFGLKAAYKLCPEGKPLLGKAKSPSDYLRGKITFNSEIASKGMAETFPSFFAENVFPFTSKELTEEVTRLLSAKPNFPTRGDGESSREMPSWIAKAGARRKSATVVHPPDLSKEVPNPQTKVEGKDKKGKQTEIIVATLEGSWLEGLWAGERCYWDIHESSPSSPRPSSETLLSDSRYREDLLYLEKGDLELAQEWKVELERRQRHDRILRSNK